MSLAANIYTYFLDAFPLLADPASPTTPDSANSAPTQERDQQTQKGRLRSIAGVDCEMVDH
jgi:hypothetical protein